jgi:TPP-dependent pyruvate/acetoin dehydrogenase alpha subunit
MSAAEKTLQGARLVLQVRYWQHLFNELLKRSPGRFRIPIHCALGHEAVAVATQLAMRPGDRLVLTHRNMAFHLAHAGAFEPVLLEYELSAAGLAQGRLGSMNLANPERGLVYTSSILGNNLPVACGMAMAHRQRRSGARVYVTTGDGAIEEGAFWESLVFAASHRLNLVFLVENNNHSLASTIAERRCAIDLARLAESVGVPYTRLEGNDAAAYAEALGAASAEGPAVFEAMVTTFCNHAGPTPGWATDPKRIALEDGLELEQSARDPAHVARRQVEEEEFASTSRFLAAMAGAMLGEEARTAAALTERRGV